LHEPRILQQDQCVIVTAQLYTDVGTPRSTSRRPAWQRGH
jgi:hypothetical protein